MYDLSVICVIKVPSFRAETNAAINIADSDPCFCLKYVFPSLMGRDRSVETQNSIYAVHVVLSSER